MPKLLRITLLDGPHRHFSTTLPADYSPLIGRDENANHIVLHHPDVSRLHARILGFHDRFVVQDMESTEGTFVDERRVLGEAPLPSGSVLRLASVRLLVEHIDWTGDEDQAQTVNMSAPILSET